MKNFLNKIDIIFMLRIVLGFVFIFASIDKIINPQAFSDLIDNYHVTPMEINNIAALIIPFLEIVIGLCLIFGVFIEGAAAISILLLIWFIVILSQALVRGIDLHCGCFDLFEKGEDLNLKLEMVKRIIWDFILLFIAFVIKFTVKEKNDIRG